MNNFETGKLNGVLAGEDVKLFTPVSKPAAK